MDKTVNTTYTFKRPMTGAEVRDLLKQELDHDWYEENPVAVQVDGRIYALFEPTSIDIRLRGPEGWSDFINPEETYIEIMLVGDHKSVYTDLFINKPDQWE